MQVTVGSQRKQFHIPGWSLILFAIVAILGAAYGGMQLAPLFESTTAADTQQPAPPAPQTVEQPAPPAAAPAANPSVFETSRVEVQKPTFQGRPGGPSANFSQDDGYYVTFGRNALVDPNQSWVGLLYEDFGDIKEVAITPVKMKETSHPLLQIQYLAVSGGHAESYVVLMVPKADKISVELVARRNEFLY